MRKVDVHIGEIDQKDIGLLPFNWEEVIDFFKEEFSYDMSKSDKIVMIGETLTTDIMFGNLNKMATIWINKHVHETDKFKEHLGEKHREIEKK